MASGRHTVALVACLAWSAHAGTWTPLVNSAPDNIDTMLLLTDGTVMAASGEPNSGNIGNAWYKLTPDIHGSYVNGTWSVLAPMNDTRLYYSSQVLMDGRVFIAGGEYGTGVGTAAVYDPVSNTWTAAPNSGQIFVDSDSEILPNGNVLVAPVFPSSFGGTILYNPALNNWSAGGKLFRGFYQDEASWVKLPDDTILTIDPFGTNSERYVPSQNKWINDANSPVPVYDTNLFEMGAGFLLPDGRAFFLGDSGLTARYTPSGSTSPGTWTAGANLPAGLGVPDAPAAMMVNGKILCTFSPIATYNPPTYFYEYDYLADAFTQINAPGGGSTLPIPAYIGRMLDLPDGTVLYSQSSQQLYVYTPDGSPLPAGRPTIGTITINSDGSYHLTGTLLNGISEGASYGDDAQMNSNYPLIRLTDGLGNVYYARTFNRSSTSVMTGSAVLSTDFSLPSSVPPGTYSLVVVANGISSSPVSFNGQVVPDLVISTNYITGGNGNGFIDPDECNSISIVVTNAGVEGATHVQAVLSSATPGVFVTMKSSGYPDLPMGAVATNLVTFQFSTSPDFICGTPVIFKLTFKTDQGAVSQSFAVASGTPGTPLQYSSSAQIAIPDNTPSGADSPIVVANFPSTIYKVTASIYLTHTYDSDLLIELVSPDGVTNVLAANVGGGGQNFGSACATGSYTVFDDAAAVRIGQGAPPFIGSFQPASPLSVYISKSGTNVNGTWHLHVVDQAALDVGVIQCWTLSLTPLLCTDGGGVCPGSDLAIGGSVAPPALVVGGNLVYNLSITNNGPEDAKGVSLVQTLPASAVFVGATLSQGFISASGGLVTGNIGSIPAGGIVTASVTVTPVQSGAFTSVATASAVSGPDPDLSNNTVTFTSQINPPTSDMAIGISAAPNPVLVGSTLTYSITVTNNGPSLASGVVVTNTLPTTVAVTSAGVSQGFANIAGNVVSFSLGAMNTGAVATATVTVVPSVQGQITATATVAANQLDSVTANNTASVTTSVSPSADLAVGFLNEPASIVLGNNLTYIINATNLGPSTATAVLISQTLPTNAVVVSSNTTSGTLSQNGNFITCNAGALPLGGIVTVMVQVQIPTAGTATSTVNISSALTDPALANNAATTSTLVAPPFVNVQAAGATLTAENFSPPDGVVEPGETVTVQLRLSNVGNISTTNLMAKLLAGGGVTSPSAATQVYGALAPNGVPGSKAFSFTASGTNGGTVVATLQLSGDVSNTVSFTFTLPQVATFANTNVIVIPDIGAGSPYPSTINVSGITGVVGHVTATLSNFNHTYPNDVSVLLVSPTGAKTLLMSHTADFGSPVVGANFTFDDSAASPLPASGALSSGTWQPTSYAPAPVFTNPAPAGPYVAAMSVFNTGSPNGVWALYVLDDSAGDSGGISNGWSLAITTINPVNKLADLTLTGVGSTNSVLAGNNLTYTFTVLNNGPSQANNVLFTNAIPTGVSYLSSSVSQGNVSTNSGQVVASLGSLAPGASATVTILVMPTTAGQLSSTGTVSANEIDLVSANNTATIATSVSLPQADVSIAGNASANTVVVGTNFVYTLTVTNNGPGLALNTAVTDTLPAGVAFVSASAGTFVGGTLTCNLGNLSSGSSAIITVTARGTTPGVVTNSVTVTTGSTDSNPSNNSASIVTVVRAPAVNINAVSAQLLSGNYTPNNGAVNPGETVTVSLMLTNTGEINTTSLVATLLNTGGVTASSGSQNYGVIIHNGVAVARSFTFTASSSASGVVTASLSLQDGANNLGVVTFAFALPQTNSFVNTNAIIIPDHGIAAPYPSTINVAGLTGLVSKVTVTLNGLTHSFPSDVGILLVSPAGVKSVILSGVGGGYSVSNLTLTLDDAAAAALPESAQIASGSYLPTAYPAARTFPSPAPAGAATPLLAQLNGVNPNGAWSLYVVDDHPGDAGIISGGWAIALTTVSPVNATADLAIAASASPGQVYAGFSTTYNLWVTNNGPAPATGVVLTNTLPAGTALGPVTVSQGTYVASSGSVIFSLGSLNVGQVAYASISTTPGLAGQATDTAVVAANETDLLPANNSASAFVTVLPVITAHLSGVLMKTNHQFQITLTGQPNFNYIIQASTNLTLNASAWTSVSTNTAAANGTFQFTDTNAPGLPQRFYRALLSP